MFRTWLLIFRLDPSVCLLYQQCWEARSVFIIFIIIIYRRPWSFPHYRSFMLQILCSFDRPNKIRCNTLLDNSETRKLSCRHNLRQSDAHFLQWMVPLTVKRVLPVSFWGAIKHKSSTSSFVAASQQLVCVLFTFVLPRLHLRKITFWFGLERFFVSLL